MTERAREPIDGYEARSYPAVVTSTSGAADARLETQGRIVRRARLAASVGHALDAGSVIITAGAGSGKTTILEQSLEGRAVAWLSCSVGEREPGALLMRLIAAIGDAIPGAARCQETAGTLALAAEIPSTSASSAPSRAPGSSGTGTAIVRSRHW